MENLNYLRNCQQTGLLFAEHAACALSRACHEELAQGYVDRISHFRHSRKAAL